MTNSKRRFSAAFLWCLLLSVSAVAQVTVADHWSPYDYPKTMPEGVKVHIIQKGDTLWDLSQQYFGNPRLWPSLHQANSYIQNPNLIYPGDPLRLDVGIVVDEQTISGDLNGEEMAASDEFGELEDFGDAEGEDGNGELVNDRSETTSFLDGASEFVILPAGDRSDMECSTYLYPAGSASSDLPFDLRIAGSEHEDIELLGTGTVVYLNQGENKGIFPGSMYSIRRAVRPVYLPKEIGKGAFMGIAIDQVGKLRILAVQAQSSTAIIDEACTEVLISDFLVPYEQEPIPLITELPADDRWAEFDKSGSGVILYSEDEVLAFGKGHLVNINLGINDNVAPGDLFLIYRENPQSDLRSGVQLPSIYLGHAVALRTEDRTAVLKIIEGFKEIKVGDLVAPYRGASFDN